MRGTLRCRASPEDNHRRWKRQTLRRPRTGHRTDMHIDWRLIFGKYLFVVPCQVGEGQRICGKAGTPRPTGGLPRMRHQEASVESLENDAVNSREKQHCPRNLAKSSFNAYVAASSHFSVSGIVTRSSPSFSATYLRSRTINSTVSTGSGFESVSEGPFAVPCSTRSSDCLALMR
jgi:hypothetical protein